LQHDLLGGLRNKCEMLRIMSAGLSPMQQATRVLWWSLRQLRYLWWGGINRLLPGRFRSIGRRVKFNGWIRFEKPSKDIRIGDGSMVGVGCYLCVDQDGGIEIGKNVGINDFCYLTSIHRIVIEDDVRIAEFVSIRDYDHEFARTDVPISLQGLRGAPIRIGQGSWIGRGVMVTSGVSIGKGCVIGANAVVTRDIPDWSVAVGVPAKVIRSRRPDGEAA
jgi:acetyltransferase-like isoleucine patch superfamily enzyme